MRWTLFLFALLVLSESKRDLPTRSASGLEQVVEGGCLAIYATCRVWCIGNVVCRYLVAEVWWKNALFMQAVSLIVGGFLTVLQRAVRISLIDVRVHASESVDTARTRIIIKFPVWLHLCFAGSWSMTH